MRVKYKVYEAYSNILRHSLANSVRFAHRKRCYDELIRHSRKLSKQPARDGRISHQIAQHPRHRAEVVLDAVDDGRRSDKELGGYSTVLVPKLPTRG